jgi:lipopolysaccharide/colanic/teichoic acid biosynthesis glycosyltransferase
LFEFGKSEVPIIITDTGKSMNSLNQKCQSEKSEIIPRWKRVLDVTIIVLALPLLLPIAFIIAAIIRMVSPGPVLFKQERVGYLGRRFMCLKFRTMYAGVDTSAHQGHLNQLIVSDAPMIKMDAHGDSRIIPFGLLLRSSGLDELPQLINVLLGEMSLAGPRPCLPYEYDRYQPWQRERFNTVPGLTGLWQVSGKNRTTFGEMIRLDIEYAKNKNLWLDLIIILKTPLALLIQMWDTRIMKRKPAPRPAPPSNVIAARALNQ